MKFVQFSPFIVICVFDNVIDKDDEILDFNLEDMFK